MTTYKRTTSSDPDFQRLIIDLDKEFWVRYPDTQQDFAPFNYVDERARVIVAYDDETAIGCGCFRPMKEGDAIEIKRMYVVPFFRNRGVGKVILHSLEQWAGELGFSISKLETGIHQPEAIAAYEKSGYTLIPNFEPYVNVKESICMIKHLNK